jgi:ABC-type transport system involved in multi-copper enzyme maturation permease subunit
MNQTTLLRYNFRVLMLNNWLLLAFPIAVSQLTVFWVGISRKYSEDIPAATVEMVTPILAAFLGAHLLSAEYRSRVGAILASRPVNIGRIVLMRLVVMLALVWSLALLSLFAYQLFWQTPYDFGLPLLACIPSTLFLTMAALTFATMFRNPLAGFGVAALYWALDLVPGAPIQPYLSLKSLSSYYAVHHNYLLQTFLINWWIAKLLLLVGALALYLFHNRQVMSIGSQLTFRLRRRAAAAAVGVLSLYLISGAILKVAYGYEHRSELPRSDLAWFRYQMSSFGPIPMTSLFGSAFKGYIGDIGNPWSMSGQDESGLIGPGEAHIRAMHRVLETSPNSIWAPSVDFGLAQIEIQGESNPDTIAARFRETINRYPTSPYNQDALRQIAVAYVDAKRLTEGRATYEELLQKYPDSRFRSGAYRFLFETERAAQHLPDALLWAQKWSAAAPVQERFEAYADVMELCKMSGDLQGAKRAAAETISAVEAFNHAFDEGSLTLTPAQTITRPQLARKVAIEARSLK